MAEKQGHESIKSHFLTYNKNKAKPMAGIARTDIIIVIAALLFSGLALIGIYQPAIAQVEELTGGAGGGTTANGEGTARRNATTTAAGGGNQTATTSEVILHLGEVRTALQNDDTETALMHLDLALMTLGGATGSTQGTEEEEYSECGGVTVGGTSAADDYGCPPDPDQ